VDESSLVEPAFLFADIDTEQDGNPSWMAAFNREEAE